MLLLVFLSGTVGALVVHCLAADIAAALLGVLTKV